MMRWLRSFFSGSDDPIVVLVGGLSRTQAEMWRELLKNDGVPSMVKNMGSGLSYHYGGMDTFTRDWDLFVKQSDLELARELLPSLDVDGPAMEEESWEGPDEPTAE